jgi:hypothetical protein
MTEWAHHTPNGQCSISIVMNGTAAFGFSVLLRYYQGTGETSERGDPFPWAHGNTAPENGEDGSGSAGSGRGRDIGIGFL